MRDIGSISRWKTQEGLTVGRNTLQALSAKFVGKNVIQATARVQSHVRTVQITLTDVDAREFFNKKLGHGKAVQGFEKQLDCTLVLEHGDLMIIFEEESAPGLTLVD